MHLMGGGGHVRFESQGHVDSDLGAAALAAEGPSEEARYKYEGWMPHRCDFSNEGVWGQALEW